jgi:hypothetical protein
MVLMQKSPKSQKHSLLLITPVLLPTLTSSMSALLNSIPVALDVMGALQTSPCHVIPKPQKPDKKRLIQNYSFPLRPHHGISSINLSVDISSFPCTWGTPWAVCLVLWSLPHGAQIAIKDLLSAYQTIPLAPDQWNGTAVRIDDTDLIAIDTCAAFGFTNSSGLLGHIADALCDILRFQGMSPVLKWVDDFMFICLPKTLVAKYNERWEAL